MNNFEKFDPTQGEQFEKFDAQAEPEPEAEMTIESLGGLTDSEDQVRSLLAVRDELENRLMGPGPVGAKVASPSGDEPYDPNNVVGVGIGEKLVTGVPTGQLAVKVLVKEKKPESRVSSEAWVSQSFRGVTTDVDETGEIYPHMFTARRRPAPCGVSIGNCDRILAGTLGCLVTRNSQLFIFSFCPTIMSWHWSILRRRTPAFRNRDGATATCARRTLSRALRSSCQFTSPQARKTLWMQLSRALHQQTSIRVSYVMEACCSQLFLAWSPRRSTCRCRKAGEPPSFVADSSICST